MHQGKCFMRNLIWPWSMLLLLGVSGNLGAAPASASFAGGKCDLSLENRTFGQILELFKQNAGLEFDIPPELRGQVLPYVMLKNSTMKAALINILEGSNCDYILVGSAADPERVAKVLFTGKSSRTGTIPAAVAASVQTNRRMNRKVVEDPFSGGAEDFDDNSATLNEQLPTNGPAPINFNNPAAGPQPMQSPNQSNPGAVQSPGMNNPQNPGPGRLTPAFPNQPQGFQGPPFNNPTTQPPGNLPTQPYPSNNQSNTMKTPF
jgi:hypothetical protein